MRSFELFLLTLCVLFCVGSAIGRTKCRGTSSRLSHLEDSYRQYLNLKARYTNCAVVQGNLEISGLPAYADMSFLKDIEVVTGYVLIAINEFSYLPLEKLKIIRGQELVYGAALYVAANMNSTNSDAGLKRIRLKSLAEIQRGNASFVENDRLCYVNTIDWSDILNEDYAVTLDANSQRQCPPCHASCNGKCWGRSAEDCQTLTKTICDATCGKSRCRGPGPTQCCHNECMVGCTGPTNADCLFQICRNVNNGGICEADCPPKYKFDIRNAIYVKNPDVKYNLDGYCVDTCPGYRFTQDNTCVKHCSADTNDNWRGECVTPCAVDGNSERECFGIGHPAGPLAEHETVDSSNIKYFEGCNIVRGSVVFQAYAFKGDPYLSIPPLTREQLIRSFSSLKVITGRLQIMSWHNDLRDFTAFVNLKTIRGVDLFRDIAAVVIQDTTIVGGPSRLEQIQNLGFRSLKSIEHGNVYIGYMTGLCYVDTVNWTRILKHPISSPHFVDGTMMRRNKKCKNDVCNPLCDDNGCWGPGDQDCLNCRYYSQEDRCVKQCEQGFYKSGNQCSPCHGLCESCTGGEAADCVRCKHVSLNGICLKSCPITMCVDTASRECMPCKNLLKLMFGPVGYNSSATDGV